MGARIDTLTVVMLVVVNTVSALVHIYSIGYMHHDPTGRASPIVSVHLRHADAGDGGQSRADVLRLGRRRSCLLSLIGFWYKKPSANAAAIKAFVVNRVGDFYFALGIFGVFVLFAGQFGTIFANAATFIPAEGPQGGRTDFPWPRARQASAMTVSACPVHGRDGQVGRYRCTPGCRTRWRARRPRTHPCGHHGDRWRVHAGALPPLFELIRR
jgi:NADH-quinone oxidoreductase subunit L